MENPKITLSIIWIAVMLTYLLGDVIRIFAGDVTFGGTCLARNLKKSRD